MVQPFMLRRTKELVADDLPEKTEIVLYCEMGKKQRAIYDSTKKKFKEKILGMIEERGGVQNAAMYVLEGLLRLRQICDSPALLNDDELGDVSAESAKLDELMEHVTERTGNHKMLVFSQFKGMLSLIRQNLEAQNVPFCYLDGNTSLRDRKNAVEKFQEDEKYRVFLISLKAGGTGLNLTAADYVYLMDPWWNPAVEQQAIDRAHRIGQQNHIFAYKMICKDSVEEKIIQLQDRKKAIAAELVTSDTGFMSSLSKNDIEFLFS
jgi:non-specific serine/threonine protein kinase